MQFALAVEHESVSVGALSAGRQTGGYDVVLTRRASVGSYAQDAWQANAADRASKELESAAFASISLAAKSAPLVPHRPEVCQPRPGNAHKQSVMMQTPVLRQ